MGSLNHLKFMVKNNLNLNSWPKSNLAEVIVSVMSSIHLVLVTVLTQTSGLALKLIKVNSSTALDGYIIRGHMRIYKLHITVLTKNVISIVIITRKTLNDFNIYHKKIK